MIIPQQSFRSSTFYAGLRGAGGSTGVLPSSVSPSNIPCAACDIAYQICQQQGGGIACSIGYQVCRANCS
jgi:hypothetical protein